jgi:hypothetical protein
MSIGWTTGWAHTDNNACEKGFVIHVEVQLLCCAYNVRPVWGGIGVSHCIPAALGSLTIQSDHLVFNTLFDSGIAGPELIVCM